MVIRKMVECVECGKKLGFFEGYSHPTLGKKNLVCGSCFGKVEESVTKWREFIISHSFQTESSEPSVNLNWDSLLNRTAGLCTRLQRITQKKNAKNIQGKLYDTMTLIPLNNNSDKHSFTT